MDLEMEWNGQVRSWDITSLIVIGLVVELVPSDPRRAISATEPSFHSDDGSTFIHPFWFPPAFRVFSYFAYLLPSVLRPTHLPADYEQFNEYPTKPGRN